MMVRTKPGHDLQSREQDRFAFLEKRDLDRLDQSKEALRPGFDFSHSRPTSA
jgi:hypothetical protein